MPSKGVNCYAYVAVPDVEVQFSVPGKDVSCNQSNAFFREHLEVDKENLGHFHVSGKFSFKVTRGADEITSQWIEINTLTGDMGDGTMNTLHNTPSIVTDDLVVTYGFYDAAQHGEGGLTNEDQCYVTVTPNYSEWMKSLIPPGSEGVHKPFSRLVLPAVHDVGMNSMQNATAVLEFSGDDMLKLLLQHMGLDASIHFGLANTAIKHIAPDIIESLAITEKDNLPTLFAIGARYFEFRPARMHTALAPNCPLPDELYFQHACIPGMALSDFLTGCVTFLTDHPFEIVVVQCRGDGILAGCAQPSDEELDAAVEKALEGSQLVRGRVDDMVNGTIRDLRTSGKRLIVMRAVDSYSTYTDEGNATLDGDSIVAAFEQIDTAQQAGKAFTNIQCQATATNVKDAVIFSAVAANASNSCIMSSKAVCDSKTLPWIREHALEKLQAEQLIVIMNDFLDGATAETAVELSRRRMAV